MSSGGKPEDLTNYSTILQELFFQSTDPESNYKGTLAMVLHNEDELYLVVTLPYFATDDISGWRYI